LLAASALGIVGLVGLLVVRERRFLALRAEFVAAVSHELRTPLASVRLLAETLERRLDDVPEAKDYPARIVREADRLSLLVENVLSFNRLEGGAPRAERTEVDLAELLAALEDDLAPHVRGEVIVDLAGAEGARLLADPELLRLLFLNLFTNACRHNARNPVRISVTARAQEGTCHVEVSDNGVGIPPDDRERIFTEFYRRPRGGDGARGFGLGLSICRRIMALHGGRVRVADSGPDGTTFALSFPMEA
jgi:two-component system, OmpR family, sensor histidine kinase SenX3